MVFEMRNMLIKKFKTVYMWVFLCGDKKKYLLKLKDIQDNEENEAYREKYLDTLSALQKSYDKGELFFNKRNFEKVQIYLSKEKVLKVAGIELDKRTEKEKEHQRRRQFRINLTKDIA